MVWFKWYFNEWYFNESFKKVKMIFLVVNPPFIIIFINIDHKTITMRAQEFYKQALVFTDSY